MSATTRNSRLIGCNVRPGMVRGGMLVRGAKPRDHTGQATRAIIEAANAVLEKRGFQHNPSPWRDMVFGRGAAAKAEKERVQP